MITARKGRLHSHCTQKAKTSRVCRVENVDCFQKMQSLHRRLFKKLGLTAIIKDKSEQQVEHSQKECCIYSSHKSQSLMASVINVQTIIGCPPPKTQNIQNKLTLGGNQDPFTIDSPSYIIFHLFGKKQNSFALVL